MAVYICQAAARSGLVLFGLASDKSLNIWILIKIIQSSWMLKLFSHSFGCVCEIVSGHRSAVAQGIISQWTEIGIRCLSNKTCLSSSNPPANLPHLWMRGYAAVTAIQNSFNAGRIFKRQLLQLIKQGFGFG